jgi:hypothetical protein
MSDTPKKTKQDDDPDAFMTRAKESLQVQREAAQAKLQAAQDELDAIDAKLDRIEAYFNPRPAPATVEPKARKPRGPATKPRAPRQSGVRDNVLAKIAENPDGIKAADLIEALGGTDNKAVETSIRNAVNALKKDGKITGERGHYKAT